MGIWEKLNVMYGVPIPNRVRWKVGMKEEAHFWDIYLQTKGLNGPKLFQKRMDPNLPLHERAQALLPDRESVTILDVGAGPMTNLGKIVPGKRIEIVAVDPLADIYDQLMLKHGVKPLVRTEQLAGESLLNRWAENTFDLVFASNCIDHSADPHQVFRQMIGVVKKGGYVLMEHCPNVAMRENYGGLHQWNFSMDDNGDFLVSSKLKQVNVSQQLQDLAAIKCETIMELVDEDVPKMEPNLIVRMLKL